MAEYLDIISLIFLVATIAVGFLKNMNIGLLAIGASIILGRMAGISDKEIYSGFDAKLFTQLVGIMYLFGVAQVNGTLEVIAKKGIASVGNKTYLVPIIIWLIGGFLTTIGPGNIAMGSLMSMVAITVAVSMGKNPIYYALIAKAGTNGFAMSPITPTGIIGANLGEAAGYNKSIFELPVFFNLIIWGVVCFIAFVLVYYKRTNIGGEVKVIDKNELGTLNKEQKITISGIIVMVVMVIVFKIDVGLASFFVAAILSFIGVCKEKSALSKVPWGTLMLICGVNVLMNLVNQLGGIAVLTNGLLSIMTESSAPAIIAGAGSLLSSVSSASGVVMPTLIPTIAGIVEQFNGGNEMFIELLSALMSGAYSSAFSPASTGGGLILAAAASAAGFSDKEQNKIFGHLIIAGIGISLLNVGLAWLGIYSFIG
ncbi:hypothetical protein AN639_02710 [Candidatus Epulonipiscium fishelsonii]|uniref:Uncharacterized protein n=1 Tax=Candidatus Epulonipiscium fishelsonii TaxID=77094 RepID=A0ACC8XG00_9FIRM|nr:hypothetical protein AN639_02710 [Epulopiscium sp. SCG-B05WGA-EpuloA1]ONI42361.1 hypothetical protein AN396_01875 [Epulopiscium sp. SCG-B11WGA-EpuloA1]